MSTQLTESERTRIFSHTEESVGECLVGPRLVWLRGRMRTLRWAMFVAVEGREPTGPLKATCGNTRCVAPHHMVEPGEPDSVVVSTDFKDEWGLSEWAGYGVYGAAGRPVFGCNRKTGLTRVYRAAGLSVEVEDVFDPMTGKNAALCDLCSEPDDEVPAQSIHEKVGAPGISSREFAAVKKPPDNDPVSLVGVIPSGLPVKEERLVERHQTGSLASEIGRWNRYGVKVRGVTQ